MPVCLVMEKVALVAEDLAGTLSEIWAGARILVAHEPAGAMALVEQVGSVDVAFLNLSPPEVSAFLNAWPAGEVHASPLAAQLAARGTQVILMGDEAEANAGRHDVVVLQRPYSSGEVARALERTGFRPHPALDGAWPD